jgi:hypothetical protein
MYYTGINPLSGKRVHVTTDYHEKQLQRALLQYNRPENAPLVREALRLCGRDDLIGTGKDCLVRPEGQRPGAPRGTSTAPRKSQGGRTGEHRDPRVPTQARDGGKRTNGRAPQGQKKIAPQGKKPQTGGRKDRHR